MGYKFIWFYWFLCDCIDQCSFNTADIKSFLQGKVLFEIEIQANGEISNIKIKLSELNNPKLERQLLLIIGSITFPPENVGMVKTVWAIDFLPS